MSNSIFLNNKFCNESQCSNMQQDTAYSKLQQAISFLLNPEN